jgi:hypothetical protein
MINRKGFGRKSSWPNRFIARHLSSVSVENHRETNPGRYSNQVPSEYKSKALLLDQTVSILGL